MGFTNLVRKFFGMKEETDVLTSKDLIEELKKDLEDYIEDDEEMNEEDKRRELLTAKVTKMFEMQNELNTLIKENWHEEIHWDFQRATMIELAELMDHYGYKWWKKQEPNIEQCKLEVIDIAHFQISHILQSYLRNRDDLDYAIDDFVYMLEDNTDEVEDDAEKVREEIDDSVASAAGKDFDTTELGCLMQLFGITLEALCDQYIQKNTLNIFRAKNGYKAGTYIKIWNGKEDNEVLAEIVKEVDNTLPDYADVLYKRLEEEYQKIV